MSNPPVDSSPAAAGPAPRPVSLITVGFLCVLFAAFFFVVRFFHAPGETAPHREAAENLAAELEWRATSASRREALRKLHEDHAREISGYAWIDQQAGVLQLPVERAMELTVLKYGAKP